MTREEAKRAVDAARALWLDTQFEHQWGFAKQSDVDAAWKAYQDAKAAAEMGKEEGK